MARRRSSAAEAAAFAALFALMFVVIAALVTALAKAIVAIVKWLSTTMDDLRSGDSVRVMRGRARLASLTTAAYVLVAYTFITAHVERSPWHTAHASWEPLGAALSVTVAGLAFLTWRSATGIGRRYPTRYALVPSCVATVVAAVVAIVDVPSRANVEALVRRGALDDARLGIAYLQQSGEAAAIVDPLTDAVHERTVRDAPGLAAQVEEFRGSWRQPSVRARVQRELRRAIDHEARELLARNDAEGLDRLASVLAGMPDTGAQVRTYATLARAPSNTTVPGALELLQKVA